MGGWEMGLGSIGTAGNTHSVDETEVSREFIV